MRKIAKPNKAVKKAQTIAIERLRKIYLLQFMLKYFGITQSTYYARLANINRGMRSYSYPCIDKQGALRISTNHNSITAIRFQYKS